MAAENDDDNDWQGDDYGGAASYGACEHCGGRIVSRFSGEAACIDCGTQSQDVRQLTHEYEEKRGPLDFSRSHKSKSSAPRAAVVSVPHAAAAFNTSDFMRGVQTVLFAQIKDVTRSMNAASAAAFRSTIRSLWSRYIARWASSPMPPAVVIDGRLCFSHEVGYLALALSRGLAPPPHAPLTPTLMLSFLLLSARILRQPLRAADIARGAASQKITFLDARSALSVESRVLNTAAADWFSPKYFPRADDVERGATVLAWNILGTSLPPANIPLTAIEVVRSMRLPVPVEFITSAIAALEVHESFHLPVQRKRGGHKMGGAWCGVKRARDGVSDASSDAAIAALIFVSMRLVSGWESWVDARMQHGVCRDRDEAHAATLQVDAAPSELMRASLSELASHIDYVSRAALTGGDMSRGRAADGYSIEEQFGAHKRAIVHDAGVSATLAPVDNLALTTARARDAHDELVADGGGDASLIALLMGSPAASATTALAKDEPHDSSVELSLGRRTQTRGYEIANRDGGLHLWPPNVLRDVALTTAALRDISAILPQDDSALRIATARNAASEIKFSGATHWRPVWPVNKYPRRRWLPNRDSELRPILSARDRSLLNMLIKDAETSLDTVLGHVYAYEILLLAYTPLSGEDLASEAPVEGHKRRKVKSGGKGTVPSAPAKSVKSVKPEAEEYTGELEL